MNTLILSRPNIASVVFGARAPSALGSTIYADNFTIRPATVVPNPVPEPSEWLAMGTAGTSVMGLMIRARRRRNSPTAV